ncbi:hypothetical protein Tco_1129388, partial [Tanacetum coccineum]
AENLKPLLEIKSTQTASLGVIGRRSVPDLGAIWDSLSGLATLEASYDPQTTMQLLESSFLKLPKPKDSQRSSYIPCRLQLLVTRPFRNGLDLTMLGLILYSLQMPAEMTGSFPVKFVFVETTFEPLKRLIGAQAATSAAVKEKLLLDYY